MRLSDREDETSREPRAPASVEDRETRARIERQHANTAEAQNAWLVRATNHLGTSMLLQWLDEEFISLGWPNLQEFAVTASEEEIRLALSLSTPETPAGRVRRGAGIIKSFLAIAPGDLILTLDAEKLYIARASAEACWSENEDASCLRRPVEWLNRDCPASRAGLKESAPSFYARLQTLLSVCDLKDDVEAVNQLVRVSEREAPSDGLDVLGVLHEPPSAPGELEMVDYQPSPSDQREPIREPPPAHSRREAPHDQPLTPGRREETYEGALPAATEQLADSLYLPRDWLQQAIDLLGEKRQLIFYGPPGTGKTFLAQALGEHIRGAGGDWQLVQFHPAYSYEDFFEGYRPSKREQSGTLHFDLRGGPLRLIAERAMANPQRPYLLVIDEINRGNIAKIFGELYFLLEYRDRPIRLQYSPEQSFELPKNLFLIGTMNTADRSIALLDSALRRRFYFFALYPQESPVREVLGRWLRAKGHDGEAALLLQALNDVLAHALPDEQFAIGPSYFMPADGPPNLERIWCHAISPLLEERFYGVRRAEDLEREFGLEAIRTRLGAQADEELRSPATSR